MFSDHDEGSLASRIGGNQSRCFRTSIEDPDGPDHPVAALLSLRRYSSINNIFLAVGRLDELHDLSRLGDGLESAGQQFRILGREAERVEELCLAAIIWMRGVQEVLEQRVSFDDGEMRAGRLLCMKESSLPRDADAVFVHELSTAIRCLYDQDKTHQSRHR